MWHSGFPILSYHGIIRRGRVIYRIIPQQRTSTATSSMPSASSPQITNVPVGMTYRIALGKSTASSWTQHIYSKHLLYQALPCTTHKHGYLESYPCQAHSPCSRVNIERGECLIHSADHYIIIGSISGYLLYAAGESVTADIPARVPDVLYGALRSESTQSIGGIKARSVPGRWCRETPEIDMRKGLAIS